MGFVDYFLLVLNSSPGPMTLLLGGRAVAVAVAREDVVGWRFEACLVVDVVVVVAAAAGPYSVEPAAFVARSSASVAAAVVIAACDFVAEISVVAVAV